MKIREIQCIVGACCAIYAAQDVRADMVLTMDDAAVGGIEIIIADGLGAGVATASGLITTMADPDGVMDGIISYSGPVPGGSVFNVNFTTGLSDPVVGSNANGRLDMSSVNVSGTGAGMLTIQLTDTGFFQPGALPMVGEIGGTTDGLVDFFWSGDEANNEFGIGSTGLITSGPHGSGAFSDTTNGLLTSGGAYSLSMGVKITHSNASEITSFGTTLFVVPAPGALVLLGVVIVCGRRCRRRAV